MMKITKTQNYLHPPVVPVIILVASDGIFLLLDKIIENKKETFVCKVIPTTGIGGGAAA